MSNFEKVNYVYDTIDFRMRQRWEELESNSPIGTTQMTIRVPDDVKLRLDLLASFLDMTRNSLVVDLLNAAVEDAIERMENHPYRRELSGGKSIRELVEEEDTKLRLSVGAI